MPAKSSSLEEMGLLTRSHRHQRMVLFFLLIAVAGGIWWYQRSRPTGSPEEASSIFIVTNGSTHYRYALTDLGFRVREGTIDEFEQLAAQKLPSVKKRGIPAILHLADWAGFGYVVFADPSQVDFSELEIAGGIPDMSHQPAFAAISVGDYAFPHRLTLSQERTGIVRGEDLDILTAVFAQEPLASVLDSQATRPTEIFALRSRLHLAIMRIQQTEEANRALAKMQEQAQELLVSDERGNSKPVSLAEIDEQVIPIALRDGSILSIVRKLHFVSEDGVSMHVDVDRTWQFFTSAPGKYEVEQRTPCTSLMNGSYEQQLHRPQFIASAHGDALLIQTDTEATLWRLHPSKGFCQFESLGNIDVGDSAERPVGVPHANGYLVQIARENQGSRLQLLGTGDLPSLPLVVTQDIVLGAPIWLDETYIAVPGIHIITPSLDAAQHLLDGIYIFHAQHPGVALRIPAELLSNQRLTLSEQLAAPFTIENKPWLVMTNAVNSEYTDGNLIRVNLSAKFSDLFAKLEEQINAEDYPSLLSPPYEAIDGLLIHSLQAAEIEVVPLANAPGASNPVISHDGTSIAVQLHHFADNRVGDSELALIDSMGRNGLRLLTDNNLDDTLPMFSKDDQALVFHTSYRLPRIKHHVTTGRWISLSAPSKQEE